MTAIFKPLFFARISAVLVCLACVFAYCHRSHAAKSERPNILIVLADDLGYGDVGCYNEESKVATPHIDSLAQRGIRFTDAHSPSTICTPSRYGLLTGRMAFRIGYGGVFVGAGGPCLIEQQQFSLPRMLREHGYSTAMVGKWHLGLSFFDQRGRRVTSGDPEKLSDLDFDRAIPDAPIHRGFDYFFGTACCPGTDALYAYIEGDRFTTAPTQLLNKTKLPKHPYAFDNREGLISADYDLLEIDLRFLEQSKKFLKQHANEHSDQPFFLLHSTSAVHLPSFAARQFQNRTKAGPHGDFIHELDYIVGELVKTIDEVGASKNTLIIVTSDNGPEVASVVHMRRDHHHHGARPWRGMKRDQWEGGHRVPFIACWPSHIKAGSVTSQPLCLTDLLATCAAIIEAKIPPDCEVDSFNLLPALLGDDGGRPIRPYLLHQATGMALAIRKGKWKYLAHAGSGGNRYDREPLIDFARQDSAPNAPGQLYDLENDPSETTNLYFKFPEKVRELESLLHEVRNVEQRSSK